MDYAGQFFIKTQQNIKKWKKQNICSDTLL